MINVTEICKTAKQGSYKLQAMSNDERNAMLNVIANAIEQNYDIIMAANRIDLEILSGKDNTFMDRLTLNSARVKTMCDGIRQVAMQDSPIGEVTARWTVESGLEVRKVRASLGVIGVIYEARPNVTADVVALCIKSANAVVLKGGRDAINSNRALYNTIKNALIKNGYDDRAIQFIDDTDRASTLELLNQSKFVDVIIPRGGGSLKDYVIANAKMPVIASAGGNCHTYVHESANIDKAVNVVINAKVQRPTVCNATEQLLIDKSIAASALPKLIEALKANGVTVKGDEITRAIDSSVIAAAEEDYYTEYHDLIITIKVVDNLDEAISWINEHNTMHSDAIIAEDREAQAKFAAEVDSGCIYINASTRFTDGFELGFGAEIGISTQKLHARGPLGAAQLTGEKYVITGDYTTRK